MKPVGKLGALCFLLMLLFWGSESTASGLGRACTDECNAFYIAASADGSEILFSSARPLVREDTNQGGDIYLWRDGTISLLSRTPEGLFREDDWKYPIWPDYRSGSEARAVFSSANSYSPADTDKRSDIYEVTPEGLTLLTHDSIFDRPCEKPCDLWSRNFTEDGRTFFFDTKSPLLDEDTDSQRDAYRYENGKVTLVSGGPLAGGGDSRPVSSSDEGAASPDGSEFYFVTAESLDPADTDQATDVYVNRNGEVHLASPWAANYSVDLNPKASTEVPGRFFMKTWAEFEGVAYRGMIYMAEGDNLYRLNLPGENTGGRQPEVEGESPDGETVFFSTESSLDPRDRNDHTDLYAWRNGSVDLVNVGPRSSDSGYFGGSHLADADGTGGVYFYSSDQLVAADTSGDTDLYLRSGGETTLLSADGKGRSGAGGADFVERFDDGRKIAIVTGDRWTADDRDDGQDLYIRAGDQLTLITKGPAKKRSSYRYNEMFNRYLGGDRYVVSTDSPLVAEDSDRNEDVYLVDLDDPASPWLVSESPLQITSGPIGKVQSEPPFSFSFRQVGARPAFECSIDLDPFRPCRSPLVLRNVKPGGHKVRVRSTGPSGQGSRVAASRRFIYRPQGTNYEIPEISRISADSGGLLYTIWSDRRISGWGSEYQIFRRPSANSNSSLIAGGDSYLVGADRDGTNTVIRTRRPLSEADDDQITDLYLRTPQETELIPDGLNLIDPPFLGGISADGRTLLFATREQLVPADTDQATDAYVTGPEGIRLMSPGDGIGFDVWPFDISADGSAVTFQTSEALAPEDSDGGKSLYWSDGDTVRFVTSGGLKKACSDCDLDYSDPDPVWFAPDGSRIVLDTAKNLLPADIDRKLDVYEWTPAGLELASAAEEPLITFDASVPQIGSHLREPRDVAPWGDTNAAVAPDGSMLISTREKLTTEDQDMSTDIYLRSEGRLKLLDPSSKLNEGMRALGASIDLRSVIVVTKSRLVPGDRDDVADIYRLKDGKAARISRSEPEAFRGNTQFVWISDDGREVAFTTNYPFDRADRDEGARDLYIWKQGKRSLVTTRTGELGKLSVNFVQSGGSGQFFYLTTRRSMLPADQDRQTDIYRISRDGKFKLITN